MPGRYSESSAYKQGNGIRHSRKTWRLSGPEENCVFADGSVKVNATVAYITVTSHEEQTEVGFVSQGERGSWGGPKCALWRASRTSAQPWGPTSHLPAACEAAPCRRPWQTSESRRSHTTRCSNEGMKRPNWPQSPRKLLHYNSTVLWELISFRDLRQDLQIRLNSDTAVVRVTAAISQAGAGASMKSSQQSSWFCDAVIYRCFPIHPHNQTVTGAS